MLEIGSGCGAITGTLAKKAASVTCIDLSKKRSLINAYRNQEYDNVTIYVGNFKDIEPHLMTDYDYVLLIGVFEYGQAYIGGKHAYEDFMSICNKHRSSNGRMVIAIENKFGLKYWAGCREDHVGSLYSGLEGYPQGGVARTFTRRGLEEILKKVGIAQYSFYYPYPDYKFTSVVYSDKYLPKKGELSNNLRNFDRNRLITFDEKLVFDQIIEEGQFPMFSNSYLLLIGNELDLVYCKMSNDRAKPWAIKTAIYENAFGEIRVEKTPDTKAANAHIESTYQAYQKLSKRYEGTKVVMDPCEKNQNTLIFKYCKGKTLEELLDECLENADVEKFKDYIDEYITWLNYGRECNVSNIDFTFPNIIVDDDKWQVIDYEWTFDRQMSVKEIAFRAFYNYMLSGNNRIACQDLLYKDTLSLTDEEIEEAIQDEKDFQKYITGQRAAMGDMREIIGYKAEDVRALEHYYHCATEKYAICEVFYDDGTGFSAEHCLKVPNEKSIENKIVIETKLPEQVKQLRIDPCSHACMVKIVDLHTDKGSFTRENIFVNGIWIDRENVLFATDDPNIIVTSEGATKVSVTLEMTQLSENVAAELAEKFTPKETGLKTKIKGMLHE